MKKLLILTLALVLLALTGCSQTPAETTAAPTTTTVPETTTEAGVDYSKYASKVNVLCYNIYYVICTRISLLLANLPVRYRRTETEIPCSTCFR